jgi:hypothetical protein
MQNLSLVLEIAPQINLNANDGFPLLRKAISRFRNGCKANAYTKWIPEKLLLRKECRHLKLPLSWNVSVPGGHRVSMTPDEIIGFKVEGSITRILLLCGDHMDVSVQGDRGDSLFLRTQALVSAKRNPLPGEDRAQTYFRPAQILIVWILGTPQRLHQLSRLCEDRGYSDVFLTDEETFLTSQNPLEIKWRQAGQSPHPLI